MGLFSRPQRAELDVVFEPEPVPEPEPEPISFEPEPEPVVEAEPEPEPTFPSGVYVGRLCCDGNGNLLADEGEWKGWPVRYHGDRIYAFVLDGEPSHNVYWHQRFVDIPGTTPNDPHHIEATPDDAHYDETAPRKTYARFDPDRVATKSRSHTEAPQ